MISRVLLLVPSFTKKALKKFTKFFNNTQVFHPMYSMLYTVNLGLCDCVGFSQIRSRMSIYLNIETYMLEKRLLLEAFLQCSK